MSLPNPASPTTLLLLTALLSRLTTTLLLLLSSRLSPYDASSTAFFSADFTPPSSPSPTSKATTHLSTHLLPFVRWDAVYFLGIAERGYRYEQEFAFFPGLMIGMRGFAGAIPFGNLRDRLVITGVLISNASFVAAAVLLYKLGLTVLGPSHHRTSLTAALLFCITPAGAFMSAPYTESLFAATSFLGMLCVARKRYLSAAVSFAAASAVRANGIVHMGFFVWEFVVVPGMLMLRRVGGKTSIAALIRNILRATFYSLIVISPFIAFQTYAYTLFCPAADSSLRPWCNATSPLIYSFVQKEYWNNGFLTYYRLHQLPNFLLALPIFTLLFTGLLQCITHDPLAFFTLGRLTQPKSQPPPLLIITNPALAPHIYLMTALTIYCATMMHVQVVVRFSTSLPGLYWVAGGLMGGDARRGKWGRLVVGYFLGYAGATTVLFGGFLPPA
ncbi:GPI mannosyltransferase 2 [Fimicolochytrium jonesii]|uniref:GPI mannosyltransferase 2 n=1 Tax=Fimicolochytrium jonesii TaxID=1396493 RepID=UPI0022FE9770|nr:GPI mannosyltransferase 2 [Fimicolochytrium jonesii]KAI8815774.1 GPI mannosyltransferase 2 [Fimicolochytrium jonesii]